MTPVREAGDDILRAAAELFGERGYKGTTTRAIAERAGVNEVTIFRRFGNKQGVLRALGEMLAVRMAGFLVESIPDPTDVRATLHALARSEVAQAQEFGVVALRLAIDAAANPEIAEVMSGGPGSNLQGLTEYLTDRRDAGVIRADLDPLVLAEGFFLLTSTLVMSRQLMGPGAAVIYPVTADDAADQLVDVFLAGILVGGGGECD